MDSSFVAIANLSDFLPGGAAAREGRTSRSAASTPNSLRSRSPVTTSKRSSSGAGLTGYSNGHHGNSHSYNGGIHSLSSSGFASSSKPTSRASSRRSSIEHILHDDSPHRNAIREAVIKRDAEALRKLSVKGFIHDAMRRLVWPLLLNATTPTLPAIKEEDILRRRRKLEESHSKDHGDHDEKTTDSPNRHPDEFQVELDVNRSFVHLPIDDQREKLRRQLSDLIVTTLRRHPALNYFQGYHDIISIILLVSEDDQDLAYRMTSRISLFHVRDSMMTGLEPAIGYLRLLKRILTKADPALASAVDEASSLPYFSLSWVLTLMAHDLTSIDIVSRIFDFLLAHNPAMVSYLSAAIVMAKKEELEHLDSDLAHDPATLHTVLSKLPPLTVDAPHHSYPGSTRSMPGSPAQSFSATLQAVSDRFNLIQNSSTTSLSSLADPDVNVPAFKHSLPSHRTRHGRRPAPIPIESLFLTAVSLYETYPLDHPDIQVSTIFGPKSAVRTWEQHDLSEEEAEQIVAEGTDVIIADIQEKEKEDLDRLPISDKLKRRRRQLQVRYILRTVFVTHRQKTIFTLVGLAGVLLALYARDSPYTPTGSRSWIRNNWFIRFCLGKQ